MQVFAFGEVNEWVEGKKFIIDSLKEGKSRFGYRRDNTPALDRIKKGDWIVHKNTPIWGRCIAAQATGTLQYDEGEEYFIRYIPIDTSTIIEFDRNDPNVTPTISGKLKLQGSIYRVMPPTEFLDSIENLKGKTYDAVPKEDKNTKHLQDDILSSILPELTLKIHEMNRGKDFERFLHKVFYGIPHTLSIENGFGWKSDHGADLIVKFENPVIGINLTSKLVVQAKSYEGDHNDTGAIDQVVTGIKKLGADAGLLITTGNLTDKLAKYAEVMSKKIGKEISIIAGTDVAKFILRYAPDLLIGSKA